MENELIIPENKSNEESETITTENVFRRYFKDNAKERAIAKHRLWLASIEHEYPMPYEPFKIGVYIRYHNQTKYDDYLDKHIQQFTDDIALCPKWTLVDFYIDKGSKAPAMECSPEWCRLLGDCFEGKVDLIVTQNKTNVSSDGVELAFIARLLAAQKHPIGIYFISDDIYTLASYYRADLKNNSFLPPGYTVLPDDELDVPMIYEAESKMITERTGDNV